MKDPGARFRDPRVCRCLADRIRAAVAGHSLTLMEVCGTHTQAIHKFGIRSMLGDSVRLVSGPGCPVCVTSDAYLKNALELATRPRVLVATYHDMLRVPVAGMSLERGRAEGRDIRGVTSALEAVALAERFKDREVVFLGVGFETTAPGTALALLDAKERGLGNFSVSSSHKTIPVALGLLAADRTLKLDGFLLPGHVSAVIGVDVYRRALRVSGVPGVVSGFEPADILLSILRLVVLAREHRFSVENTYGRIVRRTGNPEARALLARVFEPADGVWRGLGVVPGSGLRLRPAYRRWDAAAKFGLLDERVQKVPGSKVCRCADVLKGKIEPTACAAFRRRCRPEAPLGPCMVSREGTCRTYFENEEGSQCPKSQRPK